MSVRPKRRLHSDTLTLRSDAASEGISVPFTAILSIVHPASARAVQIIFTAVLTAFSSVPVQSRRIFFVSVVTRVSSPFMIGGNESTLSFASTMSGIFSNLSTIWA